MTTPNSVWHIPESMRGCAPIKPAKERPASINALLDSLKRTYKLRDDSALARFIEVSPSTISRLRGGRPMASSTVIAIHNKTGMAVDKIRTLIGTGK
jgi:hypothetical protein